MRDDEDDTPRKRSRARDDDEETRPRRKGRSFDDDDDRPRRGRRKPDNSGLIIAGAIVGGALFLFIIVGAMGYMVVKKSRDLRDNPDASASITEDDFDGDWPGDDLPEVPNTVVLHILGAGGGNKGEIIEKRLNEIVPRGGANHRKSMYFRGRLTIMLDPIRNADEFAKKINFGRVVSVEDNVISIVYDELQAMPNDPVGNAIQELKSNDSMRQKTACESLAGLQPDNRRAEVLKLLEPLIDLPEQDKDLRYPATQAYSAWATKENAPSLIKIISSGAYQPRMKFAMDALARLKDDRGIAPTAAWLGNRPFGRNAALAALKEYGSLAEDQMIKLLKQTEVDLRTGACEVLDKIGTQKCVPSLEQASNDGNPFVRSSARRTLESVKKRL